MQSYRPPQQPQPKPPRIPHPTQQPPRRRPPKKRRKAWFTPQNLLIFGGGSLAILMIGFLAAFGIVLLVLYGAGNILTGVEAGGVEVGGMSEEEAAAELSLAWQERGIVLVDGDRSWQEDPMLMGITIDGPATATRAHAWGRSDGSILGGFQALFAGAEVEPVLNIDLATSSARLEEIRGLVELPAKNAGVTLVNGQVQAVPPVQGRVLDTAATLNKLQANASGDLADGKMELVMFSQSPAVTDASPLVQEAQTLLTRSLAIEAYDPVSDQTNQWTVSPSEWGQWVIAVPDPNSNLGLSFALDQASLRTYLEQKSFQLPESSYLDIEDAVNRVNGALADRSLSTWLRVYHEDTAYIVQGGETLSSIGYKTGIPYPWIQAANPNLGPLNPGQAIQLPSKDDLLPLPIVRNKRIIISISQQEMWAYENGQVKWNWRVSTGIARSPTSPGIFQIQSHDVNAYAAQWNLYMPHFMGVYQPGPNAGVMNGFHGFPTDASGGYLLWENSLGSPATYGCILLSLENAEALFTWAEEGVVVEIQA